MWIFDSYCKGCLETWGRERSLTKASAAYPPSFYMHPRDTAGHSEMIEAGGEPLQGRGMQLQNHLLHLPGPPDLRWPQSRREDRDPDQPPSRNSKAELYNVDVRHDQRYLAEHDIFPCGDRDESRFSPDFQVLLTSLELQAAGDPSMPRDISRIEVLDGRKQRLEGAEGQILFLLQIKGLAEGTNFQVLHGIWAR